MTVKTMEDLFVDTLKDIYYAEKHTLKALPGMVKKAGPRYGRDRHTCRAASGDPPSRSRSALFFHQAGVATAKSIVALMDMTTRRSALLPDETAEALRAMGWPNSGRVVTTPTAVSAFRP